MQAPLLLTFAATIAAAASQANTPIGARIADFELRDPQGVRFALSDVKDKPLVVVAFLGTECPLAKLYGPRVRELADRFADKGVAFVGVFSNQQDSIAEIAHYGRGADLSIPLLKDPGNVVADQFQARRTPEVFLLDAERKVRYRGRIDDQYGIGYLRDHPKTEDLALAIEDLLSSRPVRTPVTEAAGCHIGRVREPRPDSTVTFSGQVVRIFQKRCQECHRPGAIGPFSLLTYEDAVGWSEMIREVVDQNRMPPWHADPKHGKFENDCRLSESEKQTIFAWVKAGSPEGSKEDLPPPIAFPKGWRIPKPDVVLELPHEVKVPAQGSVGYKHLSVETNFTEDKWVQFAEAMPGNIGVVHHIIVFIRSPEGGSRRPGPGGLGLGERWLAAYAPGSRPLMLPDGYAKRIPAGSRLVFQMHYTPNGTAAVDRSSIGLVFAEPEKVRRQVYTRDPGQFAFRIPPHDPNYKMTATYFFQDDSLLLSLFPHMHVRGKSFKYEVFYPNGGHEVLLDVPRYDFGWQNTYQLQTPKRMPAGTKMLCTAYYDNSEENLSNPDPNASVTWGEQTWEEMMFGFFDMALEHQDVQAPPETPGQRTERFLELVRAGRATLTPQLLEAARLATGSPPQFEQFFGLARAVVPQLDRICVTTVQNDTLSVDFASQAREVRSNAAVAGFRRPATGFALARFAADGQTQSIADLSTAKGFDLRLMSQAFGSSVHVPLKVGGRIATLNFWSRDADAFPIEAIGLLESLAREVARQNAARGL